MSLLYDEKVARLDTYIFKPNWGGTFGHPSAPDQRIIEIQFLNGTVHDVTVPEYSITAEQEWKLKGAIAEKIREISARYAEGGGP